MFIAFFGFMLVSAASTQTEKPTLAILNIKPENIEESKALSVYGSITNGIYKLDAYTIIERSEIAKYIDLKDIFVSGPVENRVAAKAAKSAGAKLVLVTLLSMDKGMYYLSMKLIDTDTGGTVRIVENTSDFNKVVDLSAEIETRLLVKKPVVADGTKQQPFDEATKKPALMKKDFYIALGLSGAVPIPIADAGTFLNVTIAPGLFFDLLFVFDWGIISGGVEGSFDYFGVKDFPDYYVIDVPVTIKADYLFPIDDFYFFAGVKGGMTYGNYKTFNLKETKTGFVPYVSPEIGTGYCIAGFLGISLGTSLDITIFSDWKMHMNVSPFLKAMYLF
jgi:hypothetical protein